MPICCVVLIGIRATGAAGISPQYGTAVITIRGGHDPHGVFGFSPTFLEYSVQETDGTVHIPVVRKYGSIGQYPFLYFLCTTFNISFQGRVHCLC